MRVADAQCTSLGLFLSKNLDRNFSKEKIFNGHFFLKKSSNKVCCEKSKLSEYSALFGNYVILIYLHSTVG